jgi:hypothetical protein
LEIYRIKKMSMFKNEIMDYIGPNNRHCFVVRVLYEGINYFPTMHNNYVADLNFNIDQLKRSLIIVDGGIQNATNLYRVNGNWDTRMIIKTLEKNYSLGLVVCRFDGIIYCFEEASSILITELLKWWSTVPIISEKEIIQHLFPKNPIIRINYIKYKDQYYQPYINRKYNRFFTLPDTNIISESFIVINSSGEIVEDLFYVSRSSKYNLVSIETFVLFYPDFKLVFDMFHQLVLCFDEATSIIVSELMQAME